MWRRLGTPHNLLLPFTDEFWKTRKIRLLKKQKTLLEISSFYTCVPKNTFIWGTVTEIQSETEFNVILGHFLPCHLPASRYNNPKNLNFEKMKKKTPGDVIILNLYNKKHDHVMYAYSDCHCHFRPFFTLAELLTPKIKIWKKCKKNPGYIILLHICIINQDNMMYGSWDMKYNRHNFFVILGHFLPFYPPNSLKNENIKNENKAWRYHHFKQRYQKFWS